jgi:hypothetical protein
MEYRHRVGILSEHFAAIADGGCLAGNPLSSQSSHDGSVGRLAGCRKKACGGCARRLRPLPAAFCAEGAARRPSSQVSGSKHWRARERQDRHRRRNYRGAQLRVLGNAGARPRRQVSQCQEAKRRSDSRHKGSPHRKNRRMKRQHDFNSRRFQLLRCYAPAQIAAVMPRTARAPGELKRGRPGPTASPDHKRRD